MVVGFWENLKNFEIFERGSGDWGKHVCGFGG